MSRWINADALTADIQERYCLSGVYCGISDVLMGEDGFCSIGEREGK